MENLPGGGRLDSEAVEARRVAGVDGGPAVVALAGVAGEALVAGHPDQDRAEAVAVEVAVDERGEADHRGADAEAGIAVLRVAFEEWAEGPVGQDLHKLLADGLTELKLVAQS
jgi:hypothetical protein